MANLDTKVVTKKKIDKELSLRVLKNDAAERIYVEFSSKDGKLVLQKSFQDTFYGKRDAQLFQDSLKSIDDLKNYFNRSKNDIKRNS